MVTHTFRPSTQKADIEKLNESEDSQKYSESMSQKSQNEKVLHRKECNHFHLHSRNLHTYIDFSDFLYHMCKLKATF